MKPVIGIYTQDLQCNSQKSQTYILQTYVLFLENCGAQIIPLFYKQSQAKLLQKLKQINGVLFPGGQDYNTESLYVKNADFILKYAMEENDSGNVFPILGICLGHQLLAYLTSGYDPLVLQKVARSLSVTNTVNIRNKNAQMFANWQERHFDKVSVEGLFIFAHNWAIHLDYFENNLHLNHFWDIISTSVSTNQQQFISIQSAKKYPFYSTQFHPEICCLQYLPNRKFTPQYNEIPEMLSNFFLSKARQNKNQYSAGLKKLFIDNFVKTSGHFFGQNIILYIFDEEKLIQLQI